MQAAPERSDGLVARRIGPYLVLERLGGGAMGTVYRARDLFLGRVVALKVHKRRPNEQGLRRFLQEARAAEALVHPNLSGTIDVGSEGDFYYHAMELVSGTTLQAIVRGGPLPWPDALAIALQMSAGLAAAHAAGVMHRDLKPSNVMISREGVVKLVDFGLAKQIEVLEPGDNTIVDWQSVQTSPGAVLGTPAYMAPEQAAGRPVDARSDVFALGVTLWEMVTGVALYRRTTPAQTLRAILTDPAPRLDVAAPGTPRWLADVVVRALEKEPLLRFADGAALWAALDDGRHLEGDAARADLAGLVLRSIGPRIAVAPPPLLPASLPDAARVATRQGPFVGRVTELHRLDAQLSRGARLVSLVGPGGVGKTRLVAEYVLRDSGEPVAWVALSGLTSEAELLEAMAFALGLSEREASHDRIEHRLAERAGGLVVLDGFERLLPGGLATLSRWLDRAPDRAANRTQFVLTSRVPVPLATEHAIELEGLAPDEALELVTLQLERLAPGRHHDTAQLEALARALESNPLAIALTAARVAEDGLEGVLERLLRTTQRFEDEEAREEGAPLRTALETSFHLLPPAEQHLALSLAVFDTFDVAAVEALLEAPRERRIGAQLESLVQSRLLRVAPHPDQLSVPRFALEDAVRAFAVRELSVRGDRDTLELRHAAYYGHAAKGWMELLRSDPSRESWREILAERGNLLAVGRRALVARTELFLGLGLRALSAYAVAAHGRTGDRTHVPLLASLLDVGEALGTPNGVVHAEALFAHAEAIASSDPARAEEELGRALEVANAAASPALGARLHACRAELRVRSGRVAEAIVDSRRAAMAAERLASAPELEAALLALVHAHAVAGDLDEAEQALLLAQRIAGARDDAHGEARVAILEGDLHVERGELSLAERVFERALELAVATGNLRLQCEISLRLAELAHRIGNADVARARYAVAARRAEETNEPRHHGRVLLGMGELELDEERFARALSLFREAQLEFAAIVEPRGEAFALAGAAAALATMGALHDASAELTRATLAARSLDPSSQRVVGIWAGFLDLALHPDDEGIGRARSRLGRISSAPGTELVAPSLVREAHVQAALVLEHRIQDLLAAASRG